MTEKFKKSLDQGGEYAALLTDLSKTFDCLPHDLIIAKHGVPQGSILGPILFNIFLCDTFFMIDNIDIASYTDDNTPYSVGKSQCNIETKLQQASIKLFKWFHENGLKANQDQCHFLSSLDINTKFLLPACILENSDLKNFLV